MERTELADRWPAGIAEYDAGRVTRKASCGARGVKLSTFDYWRRRLRKKDERTTAVKVATVAT